MANNDRLAVLHIISGGDIGGAMVHVINLLKKLKDKIDIKLVTFMEGEFTKAARNAGIDLTVLAQKSRADMSPIKSLKDIAASKNCRIIHCHGARANFMGARLKKKLADPKYKFITTMHSDYLLDFKGNFFKNIVYTNLNYLSLRHFDYYVGVSEYFRDMLIERGFPAEKIFYVYNGIDFESGSSVTLTKEQFCAKHKLPFDENFTYVGILARIDRVKGHEYFIRAACEALKKNDGLRFVLAGNGEDFEMIKSLASELGIADKVFFLGFIKEKFNFLNAIDINVLTSLSESFPFTLLEGALLKKATISSDVGGIKKLIIDGNTGLLFESKNYAQLAEKILELADDKQKAKLLGENLYDYAKEQFSIDAMADAQLAIYKKILTDA